MNTKSIRFPLSNYRSINTINSDIDDELNFHIDCRIDELMTNGMSKPQAEAEAHAAFGSQQLIRKKCRQINYGSRVWIGRMAVLGLMVALLAIGFLTMELISLRGQNAQLSNQLKNTQRPALAVAAIPALHESTVQDEKQDLIGKVTDPEGEPVANAKVLLIHKSWPNNRFRMDNLVTKTKKDGSYKFRRLHVSGSQAEFKLTVLANDLAMADQYIEKPGERLEFDFQLEASIPKTFLFMNDGKPRSRARVFPLSRRDSDGIESIIYPASSKEASSRTDAEGKVVMNHFQVGDEVTLAISHNGEVIEETVTIDDSPEQKFGSDEAVARDGLKGNASAKVMGSILNEAGEPVAGAKVLLMYKSWPNNRFRMERAVAKTDEAGLFVFPSKYRTTQKCAFLVSVIADGQTMTSEYVTNMDGKKLPPVILETEAAIKKNFLLEDSDGNPLVNAVVYPLKRDAAGKEFMIYPVSASDAATKTDADGKVDLNMFTGGDEVSLGVVVAGSVQNVEFSVDEETEQTLVVKKK